MEMSSVKMTKQQFLPFWLISWIETWAAFGEQFREIDRESLEADIQWAMTVRLSPAEESAWVDAEAEELKESS